MFAFMLPAASVAAARAQTLHSPQKAFDGVWSVTLTCSTASDGAFGYVYRFPAQVADGVLHGENGARGTPGWLTLDGPIHADGNAALVANGLVGAPEYAVGRIPKLTPYSYHVSARFEAARGTGTRIEIRPCTLQFTKP